MGITSLILGILSLSGVCVSLIPLLNVLNCITLPVALIGAVLGLVDVIRQKPVGQGNAAGAAGLALSLIALLVGGTRAVISLVTTGGIV
jgi:hypothetical protein